MADTKELAKIAPPRLPYDSRIEERFGIDAAGWRTLTDAIFPSASSTDAVVLALAYCRARKLDVFKKPVQIVPMWDAKRKQMVDTVWPGIGELRTTAFRTGQYAGRDAAAWGEDCEAELGGITLKYPTWCEIVVYRLIGGVRVPFHGPRVYWMETYATKGRDTAAPNAMWARRPSGQLEKCAEAAALRAAFPEEIGNEYAAEEMEGRVIDHEAIGAPETIGVPKQINSSQAKKAGEDVWVASVIESLTCAGDADDLRKQARWLALPSSWRDAYEDQIEVKLEALAAKQDDTAFTEHQRSHDITAHVAAEGK